jgi:hypothetical protein
VPGGGGLSTSWTPGPTQERTKVNALGSECRPTSRRSSVGESAIARSIEASATDRSPASSASSVTVTRPEEKRHTPSTTTASTRPNGIQAIQVGIAVANSPPSTIATATPAKYHHHGVRSCSW